MAHGRCPRCHRLRPLREDGMLVTHHITLAVSAAAVRTVGSATVRRKCPGSGRLPKGVER